MTRSTTKDTSLNNTNYIDKDYLDDKYHLNNPYQYNLHKLYSVKDN